MSKPYLEIFANGSCAPNPGTGGWGAIIVSPIHNNFTREICGSEENTTNNRMELTSVVRALQYLQKPCRVCLTTDSKYIANAIRLDWLTRWKENGWRSASRKAIRNTDFWQTLDGFIELHEIEWKWARGNTTLHPHIVRAIQLSVEARESLRLELHLRALRGDDDGKDGGGEPS